MIVVVALLGGIWGLLFRISSKLYDILQEIRELRKELGR